MENSRLDIINASYTASAVRPDQYPEEDLPEIAFIGRSNVGKSSLINTLCRQRRLALVSGTPGKTQTINFFTVQAKGEGDQRLCWYLVDLPGYGYAKRGKEAKKTWARFIHQYLYQSARLRLICQLIDLRHPLMTIDKEAHAWLQQSGVPVQVIATKADKMSRSEGARKLAALNRELQDMRGIAFSSVTGQGKGELLDVLYPVLLP